MCLGLPFQKPLEDVLDGLFSPQYFTELCVFRSVNSAWLSFGGSGDQEQSQPVLQNSRITGSNWD